MDKLFLLVGLVAGSWADIICPNTECMLNDTIRNTPPIVSAALSNGILHIDVDSFGTQQLEIDPPTALGSCSPFYATGNGSTSSTLEQCTRSLSYSWQWSTVVSASCGSGQMLAATANFVDRRVRLRIEDVEVTGGGTPLIPQLICAIVEHKVDLVFRFPVRVNASTTVTAEVFVNVQFAFAFVDQLFHNPVTCLTQGRLVLSIAQSLVLQQNATTHEPLPLQLISSPQTLSPQATVSMAVVSESHSNGITTYLIDFVVQDSCVCNVASPASPFGAYEIQFFVGSQANPYDNRSNGTMRFELPTSLADCEIRVFLAQTSISPYTSTLAQERTSYFQRLEPILLRIPIVGDVLPVSGHVSSIALCVKSTLTLATTEPCAAQSMDQITVAANGTITTTSRIVIYNTSLAILTLNEASSVEPELQIAFVYDTADLETQDLGSVLFVRLEIQVGELEYATATKSAKLFVMDNKAQQQKNDQLRDTFAVVTMQMQRSPPSTTPENASARNKTAELIKISLLVFATCLAVLVAVVIMYRSHKNRAVSPSSATQAVDVATLHEATPEEDTTHQDTTLLCRGVVVP